MLAFSVQSHSEANQSHLHSSVVDLSKVAVETGTGNAVENASVVLLPHDWPHCLGHDECAQETRLVHSIPAQQ